MQGYKMVMSRKIMEEIPEEILKGDLENYRKKALALGATDATIISTDEIIIDERVRAKCLYPRCEGYGTSAHCPPYAPEPDETKRIVAAFSYAILIKIDAPPDTIEKDDRTVALKHSDILSQIEAMAFYDGYYLALGFGGSACKSTFCPTEACSALTRGQSCRFPFQARISMHGAGMDVFKMASRAGWDVYPVGFSTQPADVPYVSHIGLVLIY
jgi:predicted metal-binding protein